MSPDTKGFVIKYAACLVGFFVVFALVGNALSHYLFLWLDAASSSAQSQTFLWLIYVVMVFVAVVLTFFAAHPFEAFAMGVLTALSAGGLFVIGYVNPFVPLAVAALAVGGLLFLRRGPLRAGYIGVSIGLIVPLCMFAYSASTLSSVKGLSYSSSASEMITAAEWAEMPSAQRESYLAGVIQTEASRLNTGSIKATQVILPKEVIATMSPEGNVLVNYAAVRVVSPSPTKVAEYETANDTEWIYERLTSPTDATLAVIHSVAHVYQIQRVAGQVKEQRTWPYEDADRTDGTNSVLDAWSDELPIDPYTDVAVYDTTLENQAWGYASNRLSAHVRSS